jgi:hypothetical protein
MSRTRRLLLVALLVPALLAAALAPAGAQARPVRFEGTVQWVAGQSMLVALDNGLSVNVDLVRVPQGQYLVLGRGERVLVSGTIASGSRTVTGFSVERVTATEAP